MIPEKDLLIYNVLRATAVTVVIVALCILSFAVGFYSPAHKTTEPQSDAHGFEPMQPNPDSLAACIRVYMDPAGTWQFDFSLCVGISGSKPLYSGPS